MKKLLLLIALFVYATADKCEECMAKCEKAGYYRRSSCNSHCILGPCFEQI